MKPEYFIITRDFFKRSAKEKFRQCWTGRIWSDDINQVHVFDNEGIAISEQMIINSTFKEIAGPNFVIHPADVRQITPDDAQKINENKHPPEPPLKPPTRAKKKKRKVARNKPYLGQRIKATDRLIRWTPGGGIKTWIRYGSRTIFTPDPVDGVFVGIRTKQNGRVDYCSDYFEWIKTDHFTAWMIIESDRTNPVFVLPEDCTYHGQKIRMNTDV